MPEPSHPMLPFLVDLETRFDADRDRSYDPTELVRYALATTTYWSDLAVRWVEDGVPSDDLRTDLAVIEQDTNNPQELRHRARRLLRSRTS